MKPSIGNKINMKTPARTNGWTTGYVLDIDYYNGEYDPDYFIVPYFKRLCALTHTCDRCFDMCDWGWHEESEFEVLDES